MDTPFRTLGPRDERADVEPLHRGPRAACPSCGSTTMAQCAACKVFVAVPLQGLGGELHDCKVMNLHDRKLELVVRVTPPVFCSPRRRYRPGPWWLRWARPRCLWPREHLHQHCTVCGAPWVCAVLELVNP